MNKYNVFEKQQKLKYNEQKICKDYLDIISDFKTLKKEREEKGLTQKQLSEISGISIKTIQAIEQNERNIDNSKLETLLNLSIALQCKISDLIENPKLKEKCKQARL